MSNPRVFISYSHDSPAHSERILLFGWALRNHGIDVELDQFHTDEIVDWPRWCDEQSSREHADFVICVCTAEYKRRIEGKVPPEKGKGVYWEGTLLDDDIYDEKGNLRIIPVLLDDEPETSLPRFLRGWTRCRLDTFALDVPGFEHLIRILTGKATVEINPLGKIPDLPTKRAPLISESTPRATFKADLSRITKYAPAELIGREAELQLLNDAWTKTQNHSPNRPRILTFVALGGEGKTSLVAKWAADLAGRDWPGCDAAFAWSFYSQGTRDQLTASSDLFLKEALTFFGDDADKAFAASPAGAFEKGQRLARIIGQRRCLLILDGLEPLQYSPTSPTPGELKDQGIAALLKGLAQNSLGLCLVTTRYSLPDLKAFKGKTVLEKDLLRLPTDAGVHLLHQLGVRKESGSKAEFEKLVEDVKGHALTLNLLGTFLRDAFGGDIRRRDLVKLSEANAEEQGGHAFHVMDAYAKSLKIEGEKGQRALVMLRLMGLFDRPATADCLEALWKTPAINGLTEPLVELNESQRNIVLKRLEDAKLLTVNRDACGWLISLDAHPLLREYFARQLRAEQPNAWRAGHKRLYEHLCATTPDKPQPTLEDLQPLYQAIAHGCQAGLQQESDEKVYYARITRGDEKYPMRKLGAYGSELGALACFFEQPWSRVSPAFAESIQAWYLSQAAFRLRAVGRLHEALEPMRAGFNFFINQKNWKNAARAVSNLSELELTLGIINKTKVSGVELAGAVRDAEQSVTYADRSGDAGLRMITRTTHADALYQSGKWADAEGVFREAEQIQAERQSAYPLLYSTAGFQYCDLLLTSPEGAAWQTILGLKAENLKLETITAVSHRATQTLRWTEEGNSSLLTLALDHLTLGRAVLYEAILKNSALRAPHSEIEQTLSSLRRSGMQDCLPRGLLTRAWFRFLTGTKTGPDSAQEDLDEAWEIAERGPMKLFMADIHLYRARLFFREKPYPWNQHPDGSPRGPADDLAAAEKLINTCGYHRRDQELADAKRAILGIAPPAAPH